MDSALLVAYSTLLPLGLLFFSDTFFWCSFSLSLSPSIALSSTTGLIFSSITLFYSIRASISFWMLALLVSFSASFNSFCLVLIASSKAYKLPSSGLTFSDNSIASFCFVSSCICFYISYLSLSLIASFSLAYKLDISLSILPILPSL